MNGGFARSGDRLPGLAAAYLAELARRVAGRRLVVWGAGRAGMLVTEFLHGGGCPPALVVDRDGRRHGRCLHGVPIAATAALHAPGGRRPPDYVLLASMHAPAMAAELRGAGWQQGRDFAVFPLASIYHPGFGLALAALPPPPAPRPWPVERQSAGGAHAADPCPHPPVTLLASAAGNFYFRELRDVLAGGLRRAGWEVTVASEHAASVEGVPIVVGPHEFFSVGDGPAWFSATSLAGAVLITTEQPQSLWFQAFAPALAHAGAVLDLTPAGAAALDARGIVSRPLPLGWYAGCDPFDVVPTGVQAPAGWDATLSAGPLAAEDDDAWAARPIDVLFVGAHSPRRGRWLDALRLALPDLRWAVHMPSDLAPLAGAARLDSATTVALARRARIVLNIHRDEAPFFEWQRIVWRGLWQRALVVTEPCHRVPGLAPARDYVEVPVEVMADTVRALLTTPGGRDWADAVRRRGERHARALLFAHTADAVAAAVRRVAGAAAR